MNWTFGHIDFSTYPHYSKEQLGTIYTSEKSVIRLWAPTASRVILRLYKNGHDEAHFDLLEFIKKDSVWEIELMGDFHGTYYTIQCLIDNKWMDEIPDPYATAVGVNGKRAMICNFSLSNPENWENDRRVLPQSYSDMVL